MTLSLARNTAVLAAVMLAATAHAQSIPSWTLKETLRLDANTEDFSRLNAARQGNAPFYIGPKEEIVVPLPQDQTIRVYDGAGKKIGSVGRKGSGPGEFNNIFRLGWVADTMWVYDALQRRLSYFSPKWEFSRQALTTDAVRQEVTGDSPKGVISDFAPSMVRPDRLIGQIVQTDGHADGGWLQFKYFIASVGADKTVKRLAEIPVQAISPRAYVTFSAAPGFAFSIVPFGNDALYAFSTAGDRFALVTTDHAAHTVRIASFKATGEAIYNVTLPFAPKAIPSSVADSAVTAATKNMRQGADIVSAMQKALRDKMPAQYPPVKAVVLARDGTTWVRITSPSGDDTMLVLGAKGQQLARVPLRAGLDVVDADGKTVWAVDTDADGLASVVKFSATAGR